MSDLVLPDCDIILASGASYDEWLAKRTEFQGLGGSDASVIAEVNPYKSAYRLWAEKSGQVEAEDISDKPAIEWGHRLEEVVLQKFLDTTGYERVQPAAMYASKQYPYMMASLDCLVKVVDELAVVDAKTAGAHMADKWDHGQAPDEYVLQIIHYMIVTGIRKGYLAVLIGGRDFRIAEVHWDEQMAADLIKIESEFWQMILDGTPPEPDGSSDFSDFIKEQYPADEAASIEVDDEFLKAMQELEEIKAEEKAIKARKAKAENALKLVMRENTIATYNGQQACKWALEPSSAYTVEANPDKRVLRTTPIAKLNTEKESENAAK